MPICVYCKTAYGPATHWEPAEHCDCGANTSVKDLRDEYRRDREPTEDELEERRRDR